MRHLRSFIRELRHRKVVRIATAYVVAAWVVMQVADVMFPALHMPAWSVTLIAVLVVMGFPLALVLAWLFELTPSGVIREKPAGESAASGRVEGPPVAAVASSAPGGGAAIDERRSVAVLPFVDMSPEHDQEYFADGLTDELLSALARIPGLRVPSRTSCFAFKGKSVDVSTIAGRLRVTHVLEGGVRKSGGRVRISAQLVETGSDSNLWSSTYERDLDDIFLIQGDIAQQIVRALRLRLGPQDAAAAATQDPRAYDLYLRGLSFYHRFGPKSLRYGIDMFRRATELDPGFARAWAGLSAIHSALAIYHSGGAGDLQASDEASRRAVALAPGLAEAHTARAVSFLAQQRYEEAAAEFELAVGLDPRSFDAWYHYARTAVHQGRFETAVELFEKASEVDPDDYQVPLIVAPIYRKLGAEQKAVEAERRGVALAERHLESYPDNARAYFLAVAALYSLGQHEKAFDWADRAIAIDRDDPNTRYNLACFYAQVGQTDRALDYLEGSMGSRSWAEHDPELDPIRGHPRFQAFMRSLGE